MLVFLIIKLWTVIILVIIFFIIPFFRSLNGETEVSTPPKHQWKNLQKDKNLNYNTAKISLNKALIIKFLVENLTFIFMREHDLFDEYEEKFIDTLLDLRWRQIGEKQFAVHYSQNIPKTSDTLFDDCRKEGF